MTLRIAQLSDCHLSADPAQPYRGQDADANLEKVWHRVTHWNPDVVLLTGDLSEDASEESYVRLRRVLKTNAPILALPGNHDEPEEMRRHFADGPWLGPLTRELGEWLIICLDSRLPGEIHGGLSKETLHELQAILSASDKEHVLLALHHQPMLVGAHWIDRYPLKNPEAFIGLVDNDSRIRCVVWGHVHHHFAEQRHGTWWLGAPSTAANSLANSTGFNLDDRGPACRTLELSDDGGVKFGQVFGNQS